MKEDVDREVKSVIDKAKKWQKDTKEEIVNMHGTLVLDDIVINKREDNKKSGQMLRAQLDELKISSKKYSLESYSLLDEITRQLKALFLDVNSWNVLKLNELPENLGSVHMDTGNITLVITDVEAFGE